MHNSDATLGKPTVQDMIEKLQEIQSGFRQNLRNLHQKLELLNSIFDLQSSLDVLKNDY